MNYLSVYSEKLYLYYLKVILIFVIIYALICTTYLYALEYFHCLATLVTLLYLTQILLHLIFFFFWLLYCKLLL